MKKKTKKPVSVEQAIKNKIDEKLKTKGLADRMIDSGHLVIMGVGTPKGKK